MESITLNLSHYYRKVYLFKFNANFLDEIMGFIEFLLKAVPTWIKKIDVDGNIVLRIDKKMRTYTVFEKLDEYYSK